MEITARFFAAASTGDVDGLIEMLSSDVVWTADSDGKVSAARKPIVGAEKVARVLVGLIRVAGERGRVEPAMYNNAPALKLYLGDSFQGVITVEIVDGRISHFYAMRNPEKLAGIDIPRAVSR
jgi:RNA polymerase sigma-70 factor (ECF subfamily)